MAIHSLIYQLDEYIFHKKRGLSKAEIIGSIVDGFIYLVPLVLATMIPYKEPWTSVFLFFAVLSCLSIVKNEWFYPEVLEKKERMLHSALYVLHPVLLYTFYLSWEDNYFSQYPNFWMFQLIYLAVGFKSVTYQIIYWNYIHED